MAAESGNKYAEKYSYEKAKEIFEESLQLVEENKTIMYIGSLAVKMGIYRQLYDYLIDRFNDLDTIKKRIDAILESRVVDSALISNGNPTYKIFHLKNNHNWKDKQDHGFDPGEDGEMEIKIGKKSFKA
jgi:hypothetical protein